METLELGHSASFHLLLPSYLPDPLCMNRFRFLSVHFISLLLFCTIAPRLSAAGTGDEMAAAATNFLNALTPEQQALAAYAFTNDERFDWHFIPRPRKGLPLKQMSSAQQRLALALLNTGLSQRGYAKALTIMSLEPVLGEMEQNHGQFTRDPDLYYFTIFGTPGGTETWGWRVEGHHVSMNFVVRGGEVLADSPAFLGANPAQIKAGPRKGLRVLGEEEDLGRRFVKSLTPEQQTTAVFATVAPQEMITGNARKVQMLNPPGLPAAKMTGEQRKSLLALIANYASRHRPDSAEDDLRKINLAGLDKVHFAWAGGLEPGQAHYYRIQGPTFLVEYDCSQNNANHIHTVWRDIENDFGDDVLRRHYEEVPHENK